MLHFTYSRLSILFTIIFISAQQYKAQCTLNLIISEDTVLCGNCVTLSAFGNMDGNIAFEEDFNNGSPTGWQFTQSVTIANNTCGVSSPDGSDFMWMGDAAVNPRDMTTVPLNLSPGGVICFEMRYSVQGDASPCEGPDESDEGVFLQYSIDNGTTWIDINYWDPNGGNDPGLTSWNQYCANIPTAASTNSTMIRWHQDAVSGSEYDHWGIDNVQITLDDPTSQITWLHDNYNYPMGSSGGENPTQVCLTDGATYTAQITNGTNTCIDSITIPVKLPTLYVTAGNDTSICASDCINLNGDAGVIVNPGGTKTYSNTQAEDASGFLGISAETNINVQNVNQQTITTGLITSVCVDNFEANGSIFSTLEENEFTVTLTTPDGCSIEMVPSGLANGPYSQVCFVATGGGNISGGNFPSPGNFNTNEPFSNLNGCSTNGTWTLTFESNSITVGTSAELTGWNITFEDIDSLQAGIYSWSPSANMTDETSFNPGVCPSTETTYVLTVVDSNNCVSAVSDSITVSISPCCNFDMGSTISEATCGNADGGIDLIVTSGSGNFTYDWGANGTNEDLMNLASGSYTVSITDVTAGCTEDTTITLTNSNDFSYTLNTTDPSCGNADGFIEVLTTGGTGSFMYSFDSGLTFTPNNTANLPAGTYTVVIQDNGGCEQTFTQTLTAECCNFTINASVTNTTCNENNGGINLTLANTSGNESFTWSNGANTQNINNLAPGSYEVTISSIGCSIVRTYTIGNSNGVIANFSATPQPTTISNSEVTLISQSTNATNFNWYIDNNLAGNNDSLIYLFPSDSAGTYNICLAASNNNCADSSCQVILVENDSIALVIPNVITPNNDGINDVFTIIGLEENYNLTIFNRWGKKVNSFSPYKNDWNGENKGGNQLSEGTYYYILENREDQSKTYEGYLNLFR